MTEAEWLSCTDPQAMLGFLRATGKLSARKACLFAARCWRRVLDLFPNEALRRAVELWEADADGQASFPERDKVVGALAGWLRARERPPARNSTETRVEGPEVTMVGMIGGPPAVRPDRPHAEMWAAWEVHHVLTDRWLAAEQLASRAARAAARAVHAVANDRLAVLRAPAWEEVRVARATWLAAEAARLRERETQAGWLRDSFGNRFRNAATAPSWLVPGVVSLAQTIYDECCFDRLPVLADALEEAGCDDAEMLGHCREQPSVHARGCWVLDAILGKG